MTTVTDSDIKEIKNILSDLSNRLNDLDKRVAVGFSEVEKKIETRYNDLDRKIETRYNDLDRKIDNNCNEIEKKIIELSGNVNNTNTKIDSLDKRMANQEFIYRAVFIAIIGGIATGIIRYFWYHPLA